VLAPACGLDTGFGLGFWWRAPYSTTKMPATINTPMMSA